MIEQMRIFLGIKSWIPLGHSFGGMLALIYAHTYPDSIDAVIYDCPMWSALHTARAIAQATFPYFEQNDITEQITLANEILNDNISPKDAFHKSMNIEWSEELNRYCHVIEMSRYNSYINEHIAEPKVTDDCWGKYISFRQKIFDSEDFYYNYLPYLTDIQKPQFLLVGEYDMTCGKFEQEWFDKHAPNGKTEILADSAHLS
jgi:proline iminopeptidase